MRLAPLLASGCYTLLLALPATAQTHARDSSANDPDLPSLLATPPQHPALTRLVRKIDLGMSFTEAHASTTGWYTMATPALSLTVSPRLSFDVATPIYLWRLAYDTTASAASPPVASNADRTTRRHEAGGEAATAAYTEQLTAHTWNTGDTFIAAHLNFKPGSSFYTLTPSLVVPTGDTGTGLSTGRVTFDVDQHLELPLARVTPLIDIGVGDSSSAVNQLVTRDATSLGALAHFQCGLSAPLAVPLLPARRMLFSSFAYEQLPLGSSRSSTTVNVPGGGVRIVSSQRHATEDNGFTNSLLVPLSPRVSIVGYYNRSLRFHLDTAAVSLQFSLRHHRAYGGSTDDGAASLLRDAVR